MLDEDKDHYAKILLRLQASAIPEPIKVACLTPPAGIPSYLSEEYHGRISKEEEKRKLEGKSGRYLVRESFSNPKLNEYTLAFNFDGNIINVRLFFSPSSNTFRTDSTDKDYKSVLELMTDVLMLFQELKKKDSSSVIEKKVSDTPKIKKKHHVFKSHFYKHPTWCDKCRNFLWGLYKQGYKCEDCDMNVHKECRQEAPLPCSKVQYSRKFSKESQYAVERNYLKRHSDTSLQIPSERASFSRCYSESLPSINEKSGHCRYFKQCARFLSAFGVRDKYVDMNHSLTRCYCMSCVTENASSNLKSDKICDVLKQWSRFHFFYSEEIENMKNWETVYFAIQPKYIDQILKDCYDTDSPSHDEIIVAPSLAYTAQDMVNENWSYKFPDTHTASDLFAQTVLEVCVRPGSYVILPSPSSDNSELCGNVIPEHWRVEICDIYPKGLLVKIFDHKSRNDMNT